MKQKSWRTTLLGIFIILGGVSEYAVALLDGDPTTEPSMKILMAAVAAGSGFIMTREQKAHDKETADKTIAG